MANEQQTNPAADATAPTTPGPDLAETIAPGVGTAPISPDAPAELRDHPRYRIVRLLGRGGMGAVYQAIHLVMDRPVALKVMRPDLTENPAAVERFRREVKAAAQLVHPNIVTAFDAEQVGNTHFLVMEYVDGRTLADIVVKDGPLPVELACDYISQAAIGLHYAAEKGMIHRDIKPQNLMLTGRVINPETACFPNGQLKILDFGLARFTTDGGSGNTTSGVILGTVDFMAPEQADSAKNADIRSDIYSLGCTFYYLLAGRVPFPEGSMIQRVMAHVEKAPPSLDEIRSGLPAGLAAVVAKMLAKKPADRFQTPLELYDALAPFHGEEPILAKTAATAPPEPVLDVIAVEPAPPRVTRAPEPKPRKSRTLLGCFLIAALAILSVTGLGAFLIYYVVNKASEGISDFWHEAMKQQRSWENLERTFTPPAANVSDEKLFPDKIGEWERVGINSSVAAPELNIEQQGRHATYKHGDRQINLYVFQPIPAPVKEGMFQRVIDLSPKEKPGQTVKGTSYISGDARSNRLTVHFDRTDAAGKSVRVRAQLWHKADWLFALDTPMAVNPEPLLTEYLDWLNSPH